MSVVATNPQKVASEDELGLKWDRCVADTVLKTGAGAGLGIIFSLLLFKRRPWPVALGTGFGLGFSTSNCQHEFRRVESAYLRKVKVTPETRQVKTPSDRKPPSHVTGSPGQSPPTEP